MNYPHLIATLNKHWRPLSKREFWYEMSWPETMDALAVSGINEETFDWIFEPARDVTLRVKRRKR